MALFYVAGKIWHNLKKRGVLIAKMKKSIK
jgi:hypothetical protein